MEQRFNASRARQRRTELGMTVTSLAGAMGVSTSHISQIENRVYQPGLGTFLALAKALKLEASELLEEVEGGSHERRATPFPAGGGGDRDSGASSGRGPGGQRPSSADLSATPPQ
ncbi:helix-turn-helix transcriptional regulator [Nocardiopsis alba]|uniref:Helix-turn-helix domain-containing protein n=1 Tax=Nocardiopsis alba TaxID=53437 RepID=A0A7K2ILC8_9ACTN|nr:helix-turn-helix transcriptional regulator [Nocardiopsis alba]MYR30706.1 helix-turn-helix domain-containing protein [Nocardiopsis alba]MYR30778.1 helix-turn-helix domain-containing protein [Nocardiopsis alba]